MALGFSGVAGGLTMGLTGLSVGILTALLGTGPVAQLISAAVYPVGFVAVIIGRGQLFTENTLYPVVVVLTERKYLSPTLRLWGVVFGGDWIGSILFATLITKTQALRTPFRESLVNLGASTIDNPFMMVFWSGVVGGWLLALVAWLVTASHWTTGQALMTWSMTFLARTWKVQPLRHQQWRDPVGSARWKGNHRDLRRVAYGRDVRQHPGRCGHCQSPELWSG